MATNDHLTPPGSGQPMAENQAGDTASAPGGRPVSGGRPAAAPRRYSYDATASRSARRREKIIAEIERNRRGEYSVPTWVLGLVLMVIIGGWLALIIFV